MMNVCRIPDRFENRGYISGIFEELDTNGLSCIISPNDGDIYLKMNSSVSGGKFLLRMGETFEFCGKVYVSAITSASASICFYHTL